VKDLFSEESYQMVKGSSKRRATNGRGFGLAQPQDEPVTNDSARPEPAPIRQARGKSDWQAVRWKGAISVLLVAVLANEMAKTAGAVIQEAPGHESYACLPDPSSEAGVCLANPPVLWRRRRGREKRLEH